VSNGHYAHKFVALPLDSREVMAMVWVGRDALVLLYFSRLSMRKARCG